ncbi:MAG: metallopeptidase family protein [Phycisphaerales bacterium]
MNAAERARFDSLVDDAVEALPRRVRDLLDEVPVVVLDQPEPVMLKDLGIDPADDAAMDELCGLHTGTALTHRSVEHHADLPTVIHLFRRGIVALAGGWGQPAADEEVYEEIRTTLLHEIGHHFGLEEDDLADLGYE